MTNLPTDIEPGDPGRHTVKSCMRKTCVVGDCARFVSGHGLCSLHYQRARRAGELSSVTTCTVVGCNASVSARGLCVTHYYRLRANGDPDVVLKMHFLGAMERWRRQTFVEPFAGCRVWTGSLIKGGYAHFANDEGAVQLVHVWSHEQFIGPVPEGYEVDHLCKRPACSEPQHLEAVPPRVNWERSNAVTRINALKSECIHGHPFDDENTIWEGAHRHCRVCRRETQRRYKERQRQKLAGHA